MSTKCQIQVVASLLTKEKKVNIIKKLLQTYSPKPIKNALVCYDHRVDKWALVDATSLSPQQHFDLGVMKDVEFESRKKVTPAIGCGGPSEEHIGIAKGDLYLHKESSSFGGVNLSFKDGRFIDTNGQPVAKAQEIALMPSRHAIMFKE